MFNGQPSWAWPEDMNPLRRPSSAELPLGWTVGLLMIASLNFVVLLNNGGDSVLHWVALSLGITVLVLIVARLLQVWLAREK